MPQLVQLLRRDHFEALKGVLMTLAKSSALLCHRYESPQYSTTLYSNLQYDTIQYNTA